MNHESSSSPGHRGSMAQLVERAGRHWEASRQSLHARAEVASPKSRALTVALSREAGTQGALVAEEVGRLLGWPVYDNALLEQIAQEMGLRTALLESVDEREQSWLLKTVEGFATGFAVSNWGASVSESAYVHHLVQTVLALGLHGECVIVGRGAPFILPAETTLRVRLIAPVQERVAALGRSLGIPEREAARKVRTLDRERTDFVRDRFFKDPTDPQNYDLLLNVSRLSVTHVAEVIVEALRRFQAQTSAKSVAS